MEHHANLVPWQRLCLRTGANLQWIGITDEGRLDLEHLETQLAGRTKVLALTHQSNVLRTVNPIAKYRRSDPATLSSTSAARCTGV